MSTQKTPYDFKQSLNKALYYGRSLLLLVTILALMTFTAWLLSPQAINNTASFLILDKYLTDYKYDLALAKELSKNNQHPESYLLIESLLNRLTHVQRTDSLYSVKKDSYKVFLSSANKTGKRQEAIKASMEIISAEYRDLDIELMAVETLLTYEESKKEGLRLIRELNQKFPNQDKILSIYVAELIERGLYGEAFHSYYGSGYLNISRKMNWYVTPYYKDREKTSSPAVLMTYISTSGVLRWAYNFSEPLVAIAVSHENHTSLSADYGVVKLRNKKEEITIKFDHTDKECYDSNNPVCPVYSGTDQVLIFINIPEDFDTTSGFQVQSTIKVRKPFLEGIDNIIKSPANVINQLKAEGYNKDITLLNELNSDLKSPLYKDITRVPL